MVGALGCQGRHFDGQLIGHFDDQLIGHFDDHSLPPQINIKSNIFLALAIYKVPPGHLGTV
jgi:hypothetical protein